MTTRPMLLSQEIHSLVNATRTPKGRVIVDVLVSHTLSGTDLKTVVEPYEQNEILWESKGKVDPRVAISEWLVTVPALGDY